MVARRTIATPRLFHIAAHAIEELHSCLNEHFDTRRVLLVTGKDRSLAFADVAREALRARDIDVDLERSIEGSIAEATAVGRRVRADSATTVVAIGGGRPIDVAKLAAAEHGVDLVVVPSVLSHDGICSPVASLTDEEGMRRSLPATMPAGVIVDIELVRSAPLTLTRAGIGDLVSNLTATYDWRVAASSGVEAVDEFAASLAELSARSIVDVEWPPGPDDLTALARGLVLSGLAMEVAGSSRPCSGAEHLISHALDELQPANGRTHGEQVALGTMIVAHLHEHPMTGHLVELFKRIGCLDRFTELGIDRQLAMRAIQRAPGTRPDRLTILDQVDLSDGAVGELVERSVGQWLP